MFNLNITECTNNNNTPKYEIYSTYISFKEYYNLDIINNTPLLLNKYEPLSVIYLRTALYILDSINATYVDLEIPLNPQNISNQFYENMLVFHPVIVNNIMLNLSNINTQLNNLELYEMLTHFINIDKEKSNILSPFTIRDINLINSGFKSVRQLDTNISEYKIPVDLIKPWKLPEPEKMPDCVDKLMSDLYVRIGRYQNIYNQHNLSDELLDELINSTVHKYHTDYNYWGAFSKCSPEVKQFMAEHIFDYLNESYLKNPNASRLQMNVHYRTTLYFYKIKQSTA